MLRGLTVSTIVHASVLAMAVLSWPHQKSDCDKMIERLKKEEPGLAPVDILMRIPQCASAIDVPIDFVEIGLVTDIAPVQKAEEPEEKEEEAVPEEVEAQPEPPPEKNRPRKRKKSSFPTRRPNRLRRRKRKNQRRKSLLRKRRSPS